MISFIKASLREIKHVVWPTKAETAKYFVVVLSVLVLFGVYLFIFSNIFSYVIFFLKDTLKNIL
ncbi:MAG: preprotein translocase subunit SecE [Candidatus Gracilibacteria bacterium]|jgi:preprotein translocase SecE subunit|nr:preprotein translocase subunit SecE [Candidatus Gracilibacteria bacterium]